MKKNNMNNPRGEQGCKPGEVCNPKQSTQKSGQQGQQKGSQQGNYNNKPFSGSQDKQTKSGFGQGNMSNKGGMGQQNKWKSEKEEDEDTFENKGYSQGNSKK